MKGRWAKWFNETYYYQQTTPRLIKKFKTNRASVVRFYYFCLKHGYVKRLREWEGLSSRRSTRTKISVKEYTSSERNERIITDIKQFRPHDLLKFEQRIIKCRIPLPGKPPIIFIGTSKPFFDYLEQEWKIILSNRQKRILEDFFDLDLRPKIRKEENIINGCIRFFFTDFWREWQNSISAD